MKPWLCLPLVLAFACYASAEGEIIRRNRGVIKLLPGNQTTISGGGVGVVTVGVDGSIATDTGTLSANYSSFTVAQIAFNSAVNSSTDTLNTRISTSATAFNNVFSTHSSVNYQQSIDSGTLQNAVAVATGGFKSDYSLFATSVSALAISARTSTDNFRTEISTTISEMQGRSVPVRFSNEGSNLVNITAVDCVGSDINCTASGSTVTMTVGVTVSTGGNNLYLSPSESTGPVSFADIYDTFGATNAINTVGAYGLLGGGNTVQANIVTLPGVFKTFNTTIPVGVNFGGNSGVNGSSSVWVYDVFPSSDQTMFTVYGRLHDIVIDCSSASFRGDLVVLKQGGVLENVRFENCINHAATTNGTLLYITSDYKSGNAAVVPSTTVAYVKNVTIADYKPIADFTLSGDGSSFRVIYAQRVEINDSFFGHPYGGSAGAESTWWIHTSSWIYWNRTTFGGNAGRNMQILGNMGKWGFDKCTFIVRYNAGNYGSDSGYITLFNGNAPPSGVNSEISSGSYITNNTFVNKYGNWGSYIKSGGTRKILMLKIAGNYIDSSEYLTSTDIFADLSTNNFKWAQVFNNRGVGIGTLIQNTAAYDTYLSNNILDSVTATRDIQTLEIDTASVYGAGYKYVNDGRLIKNDGVGFTYTIAETQANCGTADVFLNFNTFSGNEGSIACTGVGGVVAYNTFTGSHYTFVEDRAGLEPLMLLETLGESLSGGFPDKVETKEVEVEDDSNVTQAQLDSAGVGKSSFSVSALTNFVKGSRPKVKRMLETRTPSRSSPKGQLVKSQICKTRKSPKAWVFWAGQDKEGRDMGLGLGTGYAIVYNEGANIQVGDYLMSSDQAGLVVKQDDDLLHNYTVAQANEPIVWGIGETQRKIAVIYKRG